MSEQKNAMDKEHAATVTSKGQVTIPVAVRNALGLRTGDRIVFRETTGDYASEFVLAKDAPKLPFARYSGYLRDQVGGQRTDELVEQMRGPGPTNGEAEVASTDGLMPRTLSAGGEEANAKNDVAGDGTFD